MNKKEWMEYVCDITSVLNRLDIQVKEIRTFGLDATTSIVNEIDVIISKAIIKQQSERLLKAEKEE